MAMVSLPEDSDRTHQLAAAMWRVYARSEQGIAGMEQVLAAIPGLAALMTEGKAQQKEDAPAAVPEKRASTAA